MTKKIKEMFAPPIGIDPIRISGTTFYTSERLKEKFILAFEKSSKGSHISDSVSSLVKKGRIIPCFRTKGIFSFIKDKLSSNADKYIAAFYLVDEKKIVVLIDNNSTIFGTSSNNTLASSTMHECMHLAAAMNLPKFVSLFQNHLRAFYTEFYQDYFKIDEIESNKINEIIKYLIPYEKNGLPYVNKNLPEYFKLLQKLFEEDSSYDEETFNEQLTTMIVGCKLLILNFNTFQQNANKFNMIFTSLNLAYERAFGERNNYTTPIQELFSLSEIACVVAEMRPQDSAIKQIFKSIA